MSYEMEFYDSWVKMIPAQFQDKPVILATIKAISKQMEELTVALDEANTKTTIEDAIGVNLDYVGGNVNMSRTDTYRALRGMTSKEITDETYRNGIKYKVVKNNTDCGYEDIMKCLYLLWGERSDIKYREDPAYPATILIAVDSLDIDAEDPVESRPLTIRPGGVDFIFTSIFVTDVDMSDWEVFDNMTVTYNKRHYFNGAYKFDGSIKFAGEVAEEEI